MGKSKLVSSSQGWPSVKACSGMLRASNEHASTNNFRNNEICFDKYHFPIMQPDFSLLPLVAADTNWWSTHRINGTVKLFFTLQQAIFDFAKCNQLNQSNFLKECYHLPFDGLPAFDQKMETFSRDLFHWLSNKLRSFRSSSCKLQAELCLFVFPLGTRRISLISVFL